MEFTELKKVCLDARAKQRERLYLEPELTYLFFELTQSCNSKCFHCGSRCEPGLGHGPSPEEFMKVLDDVKANFDISRVQLCITGGEPEAVGNTSLKGATLFAFDEGIRERFIKVASNSEEISLADSDVFQEEYLNQMYFEK